MANITALFQPPLGGCVLKQQIFIYIKYLHFQPPLGGCVLKHHRLPHVADALRQPPLGGCVLKQYALSSNRKPLISRL